MKANNRRLPGSTALPAIGLSCLLIGSTASASDSRQGAIRESPAAGGFFYGLALGIDSELYRGTDEQASLLPVLGYRGERLTVFGPFVTWQAFELGEVEVDLRLSPRFDGFEESDSDIFEGMEDRENSLDVGFGLAYQRGDWKFELTSLHDALDRSDGRELTVGLARAYRAGPVSIEPGIGLSYLDRRHVDYYYGVTANEASGFRPAYDGDSALNTTLGVTLLTPAWFGGLTRISLEQSWFDSSIEDSPLTDTDTSLSLFITFSRFFGS